MATFFVGQRVRVVRVIEAQEALGREGRIIGRIHSHECWAVSVDGIGPRYKGVRYGFDDDQLEPILPDGHHAGDYSLSELLDQCKAGEGVPA